MAITAAILTQGGTNADATSFTTASVTLAANRLALLAVCAARVDTTTLPTITGLTATWVQATSRNFNLIASPDNRILVFRTMVASQQVGTVLIDYGASSMNNCAWTLVEFAGMDTSGTNGSGAIVQAVSPTATDAATSYSATLVAFGDAVNNAAYFAAAHTSADAITLEAGYTTLGDQSFTATAPGTHLRAEWKLGEDLSPSMTTASNRAWGGGALEIKMAAAASSTPFYSGWRRRAA